ncbi:bacteriophage holin [Amycolatopsis nigrescens]|uniref:bacteriophage holin n=1 Tax=Amycolatopsis nigrescens TaxID=381445 RepID=UPI0004783B2E|nr:bacteriophage holin [Amycolatopsis nigrescens]
MSYLPSIALAVLGILLLGVLLTRIFRLLRRFRHTMSMVATDTQDKAGLLRARSAAIRVAIQQRRDASAT